MRHPIDAESRTSLDAALHYSGMTSSYDCHPVVCEIYKTVRVYWTLALVRGVGGEWDNIGRMEKFSVKMTWGRETPKISSQMRALASLRPIQDLCPCPPPSSSESLPEDIAPCYLPKELKNGCIRLSATITSSRQNPNSGLEVNSPDSPHSPD